jgi:hypothetical protein
MGLVRLGASNIQCPLKLQPRTGIEYVLPQSYTVRFTFRARGKLVDARRAPTVGGSDEYRARYKRSRQGRGTLLSYLPTMHFTRTVSSLVLLALGTVQVHAAATPGPRSSLTKRNCTFDSIAVLIVVCQLLSAHCRVRIPEHLLLHTRSKRRLRAHLGQVLRRVLLADNVQRVRTVLGNVCRLLYVGFLIFCVNAVTDGVVVTCIPQGEAA